MLSLPIILSVVVFIYTCARGLESVDPAMQTLRWAGPSPATRWIRNFRHHILDGGCAFIKTADGLAALVGGMADISQARTTELGAVSAVRNAPAPILGGGGGGVHSSTLVGEIEIHGSILLHALAFLTQRYRRSSNLR